MTPRTYLALPLAAAFLLASLSAFPASACCPAPPSGKPVVNADQTVLIIWDAQTRTQHFIRKASFKSEADDFGFLVPTPSVPELEESGNEAFPYLQKLTEPETIKMARPSNVSCGCMATRSGTFSAPDSAVRVLAEKEVAGFNTVVLEADSADALVGWLKEHGYAFSPEVQAWAKPYVEARWKITALKVAAAKEAKDQESRKNVAAAALRMSFQTDRPLFPYREPDSTASAKALGASSRLLRIYFVGEARVQGELTKEVPWTGRIAWSNKLKSEERQKALELLKLPPATGPAEWWLTEFEDAWPYQVAPADLHFARDADQQPVRRPPVVQYVSAPWPTDVMALAAAAVVLAPPLVRRCRRARR